MQLDHSRPALAIFEMQGRCLQNIGPQLFPCIPFREDRMPERTTAVPAFFRIPNLENQLHNV